MTLPKEERYNWLEIKKDFVSNPEMTYGEVAEKHRVSPKSVMARGAREKWVALRDTVQIRTEQRMLENVEKNLAEIKERHSTIGKMLQHEGVKAIRKGRGPRTAKEALSFTAEGVRIEREAEGLEQQNQPQVVTIIQQQKEIIGKYKVEEGEVVEEGEK